MKSLVLVIGLLALACAGPSASPTSSGPASPTPTVATTAGTTATAGATPTATATASPALSATPDEPSPTGQASPLPTVSTAPTASGPFVLTSAAFAEGDPIPSEYTCDGADLQLPIEWYGVPDGTVELALIIDDPDAGGFVHWVVVGIAPEVSLLTDPLPDGARHGRNGFGRARYDGPCPPAGTHTYVMTLYALSEPLVLDETPGGGEVRRAAQDVTIARAELRGTYRRNR